MRTGRSLTAVLVLTLLLASEVLAQTGGQRRTFVASGGSDLNNCSLAFPCRSIARALEEVAPGGEVVPLDSAGYGPFTVVDSVTLSTPPGVIASITATTGNAITVTPADGATVILRGLSLTGLGTGSDGIQFSTTDPDTATLIVERVTISDLFGSGILAVADGLVVVNDSTISDTDFGIALLSQNSSATNGLVGSINRVNLLDNRNGITVQQDADVTVTDSVVSGNATSGVFVHGSNSRMGIERSVLSHNGTGIFAASEGELHVTSTTIVANPVGGITALDPGTQVLSRGNNTVEGNGGGETFSGSFDPK